MSDNFYRRASGSTDFYSSFTIDSEPNIRQELIDMFDGKNPQIPKAQIGVLRCMRRDSRHQIIQCPCVDSVTKEPDKDRFCPICYGEGAYWDEHELQYYALSAERRDLSLSIKDTLEPPGLINVPTVVFYIRYDSHIHIGDKIVRLETDLEGVPIEPICRRSIFKINTIWDYRADNGKLEYWKIYTHKENVKYLNVPEYDEV